MTAYLCVAIDTKKEPAALVGWRVMSEEAQMVTRVGNGIEWAQVYSVCLGNYEKSAQTAREVCRTTFPWLHALGYLGLEI